MVKVREATLQDLADLMEIDRMVIDSDSRRDYIWWAIEEGRCFLGQIAGVTVGYATFDTHFFGNCFISLVIASPDYRRQGVASTLMRHIESICPTEKLFSSTNESNTPMKAVFERLEYVRSGWIDNLDEGDPEVIYFFKRV